MLKEWIPDLTRDRFDIVRHHQLLHGRGIVVSTIQFTRMYVALGQLSHFVNYKHAHHPEPSFAEKKLKLSSNEELNIPNAIRSVIPYKVLLLTCVVNCTACTPSLRLCPVVQWSAHWAPSRTTRLLVLAVRRAGKKNASSAFIGSAKSIYYARTADHLHSKRKR